MTDEQRVLAEVREEQGTVFLALDNGEVLELAPQSVPRALPAAGESISSPLLAEIRLAAERKIVARRLFAMLDRRLYPVARLRAKLDEGGYSDEAIEAVLEQMAANGIYSDRQFAEAYCRDCLRSKAVGRRYLENKLREKRVSKEMASTVPSEILDTETEKELALKAARDRWPRVSGLEKRKAEARITRFLIGRGFPVGVARQAVRQVQNEDGQEDRP